MAVVGEAYVVVRANTSGVERDIKNGFNRIAGSASAGGRSAGQRFSQAFNSSGAGDNVFSKFSAGIRAAVKDADSARNTFHNLVREGYALGTAFAGAVGGISAAIGGITSLAGAAAAAIGSVSALGNTVASLGLGLGVAKLALGGVGGAISKALKPATGGGGSSGGSSGGGGGSAGGYSPAQQKAAQVAARKAQEAYAKAVASANEKVADAEKNLAQVIQQNRERMIDANNGVRDAQIALNDAIKEGQKEIRDLGFQAEDAALKEKQAGLDLQKARAALAAVQDLPPNSQARQAAELAYQQAELAYREAKASASDLQAEQARLAKTGVSGTDAVTQATKNLQDAQDAQAKAARDALQDQADAQDALNDAKKDAAETKADKPQTAEENLADKYPSAGSAGSSGGGGGGVDPFAGLNEAQKNFAKFIISLKPKFDELKKIAAEGFLPPLQEAIQNLVDKAFPTVANGVDIIAKAMGAAAVDLSKAITSGDHMADLTTIFEMAGQVIRDFGKIAGSLFGIVVTLMAAAAPLTERFTKFLVQAADKFDKFLDKKQATGELTDFFKRSGDLMAQFGRIFGNVFKGLGAIITANFGPGSGGQIMLDWLEKATSGFATMGDTAKGKADLAGYFRSVANNAKEVLGFLGDMLKIFIDLGANPAIGEAFAILRTVKDPLEQVVKASADAAPAMAELIVKIVEIIKLLQDTGAIEVFFDTLSGIADTVISVLSNPAIQQITIITGRFAAALAAFGLVGKGISFGFSALSGSVALASKTVGGFVTVGKGLGQVGKAFSVTKKLGGSLTTTFAEMTYSTNPLTRAVGRVGGAATSAGKALKTGFTGALGGIKKAGSAIGTAASAAGRWAKQTAIATAAIVRQGAAAAASAVKIALQTAAQKIAAGAAKAWAVAQRVLNLVLNANPIGLIVTAVGLLVAAFIYLYNNVKPFRDFIQDFWKNVVDGFNQGVAFFQTVFQAIGDGFNAFIDFVRGIFGIHSPSTLFADFGKFIVQGFVNGFNGLVELLQGVWGGVTDFFSGIFTAIGDVVKGAVDIILTLFLNFTPLGLIIQYWGPIVDFISGVFTNVFNFLQTIFTNIGNFVNTAVQAVIGFIVNNFNLFVTGWQIIWQAISDTVTNIWNAILGFITPIVQNVVTFIQTQIKIMQIAWGIIWTAIKDVFTNIWNGIKTFVQGAIGFVRDTIKNVTNAIKTAWNSVWGAIKDYFTNIWNGIKTFVSAAIGVVRDTIRNVTGAIRDIWNSIWGGIRDFFLGVWGRIKDAVSGFKSFFRDAFSGIAGFVKSAFDGVLSSVKTPINGIIGLVNKAIRSLNGLSVKIPSWVPGVGGQTWGLNLPTIPQLAKGGIVMPSNGGTLVNVAEAGRPERVEPLDKNGLSDRDKAYFQEALSTRQGVQITVNGAPGQDVSELAAIVSREVAWQMRKGGTW